MVKESVAKPFYSVLILAFVCSLLVSGAAVGFRPMQEKNKQLDQQKNILRAAGLYQKDVPITDLFQAIEVRVIELSSGKYVPKNIVNATGFNQKASILNPETSKPLNKNEDSAGLRRLEKYSLVYLVKKNKKLDQVILPVRGKGLWSTMYGYVAVDADLTTIRGITFYEHGETPGLGGEIENKQWQIGWQLKKIYNASDTVALNITKNNSGSKTQNQLSQIDGISGATLTSNGVEDLMHFWFGEHGFKPFFQQLKKNRGQDV